MRSMLRSFVLALFVAGGLATFSSPAAGDQWPVDQEQMIMWDSTGLTGPVDLHLVPKNAMDTTVIITEIAIQVENTGTLKWAPPKTIVDITEVKIIIIDAKKVTIISEAFIIIIIDTSKMTSTKKLTSTTAKTSTTKPAMALTTSTKPVVVMTTSIKPMNMTTVSAKATVAAVTTLTSTAKAVTTVPTTAVATTVKATTMALATTLTTPAILMTSQKPTTMMMGTGMTTSKAAATVVTSQAMTTAKGLTTPAILSTTAKMSTMSTMTTKAANVTVSTTPLKVNATQATAAPAKQTVAGAASHMDGNMYSIVGGALIGVLGMLFL